MFKMYLLVAESRVEAWPKFPYKIYHYALISYTNPMESKTRQN